jgi:RTX calcium-binding nonapeptide repeat (4 copies)
MPDMPRLAQVVCAWKLITPLLGLAIAAVMVLALGAASASAAGSCGGSQAGSKGANSIRGSAGADKLSGGPGADGLTAKRGPDCLSGGRGPDQLLAGPGLDQVSAGPGRDLVSAQDGLAETIDCGPGDDLVSADASDTPVGCETVHLQAPQVDWMQFYTWINAYGKPKFGSGGWGFCKRANAETNNCTGRAEEGRPSPFDGGGMTMDWDRADDGQKELTVKATERDGTLHGFSNRDWSAVTIDYARVPAWANPNNTVIRTGSGEGGTPGALQAYLGFHGYSWPHVYYDGYHLSLKGWLKIIRF